MPDAVDTGTSCPGGTVCALSRLTLDFDGLTILAAEALGSARSLVGKLTYHPGCRHLYGYGHGIYRHICIIHVCGDLCMYAYVSTVYAHVHDGHM